MCALDKCVCSFVCVGSSVHIPQRTWRSEGNLLCLSSPSTLFMTGTLVHYCVCQVSWPEGFQRLFCLHFPSWSRSAGITNMCTTASTTRGEFWGFELRSLYLHDFTHGAIFPAPVNFLMFEKGKYHWRDNNCYG